MGTSSVLALVFFLGALVIVQGGYDPVMVHEGNWQPVYTQPEQVHIAFGGLYQKTQVAIYTVEHKMLFNWISDSQTHTFFFLFSFYIVVLYIPVNLHQLSVPLRRSAVITTKNRCFQHTAFVHWITMLAFQFR
jgi:hypothetical protein